eukprot:g2707.t1
MGITYLTLAFFICLFRPFAIVALPYNDIKNSYDELKQIYGKVNHEIGDSLKLNLSVAFLKKFGKSFDSLQKKLNVGDRNFRDVYKIYFNAANIYNRQKKYKNALEVINWLELLPNYYQPLLKHKLHLRKASLFGKLSATENASQHLVFACHVGAIELGATDALALCETCKSNLQFTWQRKHRHHRSGLTMEEKIRDVLEGLRDKRRHYNKNKVRYTFSFHVPEIDRERHTGRNFAFIENSLQDNAYLYQRTATFQQPTDLTFIFDDCGVFGWRDRLAAHQIPSPSSIRIRWEDECPQLGHNEGTLLCGNCVRKADVFLFAYEQETKLYHNYVDGQRVLIHAPQAASPRLYFKSLTANLEDDRRIDILLTGYTKGFMSDTSTGASTPIYPLRLKMERLALHLNSNSKKNSYDFPYQITLRQHPGYGNCSTLSKCYESQRTKIRSEEQLWDYSKQLQNTKIAIVTKSMRDYSLRKYVECAMAGALIVGDVPSHEPSFKKFVVEIHESNTEAEILNVLKYWLFEDKKRTRRAAKGQRIVMTVLQRTWKSWAKAAIGGAILYMQSKFGIYNYTYAKQIYAQRDQFLKTKWIQTYRKKLPKLLYISYAGNNNIGDDVMLSIFLKLLSRMFSNLTIEDNVRVQKKYDKSQICLEFLKGKRRHDYRVVIGGGSVIHKSYLNHFNPLPRKVFLFGSGYDDYNLHMNESLVRSKLSSTKFQSFFGSINHEELIELRNVFGSTKYIYGGVRGRISEKLLSSTNFSVKMIRDSGLLAGRLLLGDKVKKSTRKFKYLENDVSNTDILAQMHKKQRKYVVLNYGTSTHFPVYGGNKGKKKLQRSLLKLAKYFQSTWHFLVFFVPMSINDISHNSKLAKKANAIGVNRLLRPKLLLHLLKYAEIVVGVKLHLSVLAASVYTPFVLFPYRLKGYDFVHSSNETMKLFVSGSENFKAIKQKVSVTLKRKKEVRSNLRRLTASVYQAYKAEMRKFFHLELLQQRKAKYCLRRCNAVSPDRMGFHILEEC